ncbi:MAG: 3-dehydroquinate synthase, partial [Planctomycetaceae bacterium]|nr:3-dehydroquinate synthase [Planctomycetaceae bacterium]
MSGTTVHVDLGPRSYDILVGQGLLSSSATHIAAWVEQRFGAANGGRACIITDINVRQHATTVLKGLQDAGWTTGEIVIEPGEPSKRLEVISAAYDQLVAMPADRQTVIVAVGGGVVGDAAGFVAATFARGLPFVQVPTTLLADVDSSVGGKVGINHPQAKNLIGAFHQPVGVLIDTSLLNTLPDREYCAGLAEVVKYGVILDAEFFEYLEQNTSGLNARDPDVLLHAIARSCELKAQVVAEDEFERTGLRAVLNYGHTFCHAFEALCGYGELLHGEAVSIGMVCASRLAERLGRVDTNLTQRQVDLLSALHLPVALPQPDQLSIEAVIERMRLDKKTVSGSLRFVLPTKMG